MRRIIFAAVVAGFGVQLARAADWPMYRADAGRSGYTSGALPAKLTRRWVYEPPHAPQPAWQGPDTRMRFDHAYQPVIAGGKVYLGSSADGKVYALDAATGEQRWTFLTGGPVRFAPAVWKDRVYAASDDGYLYCLAAATGGVLWKRRGGPDDDMVLGNGRMVSRWPARGGPVILDDTVYFAAGIWPSEGIYVYALDPATGDVCWVNDNSGGIEMDQPHGGARAKSGISAQGYLVAAADRLLIPTGRAVPAALSRADGTLDYFHLQENKQYGGSPVMATNDYFFNNGCLFDTADGKLLATVPNASSIAISPEHLIWTRRNEVVALDRTNLLIEKETFDRKGNKVIKKVLSPPAWTIEFPHRKGASLIAARRMVIAGTSEKDGHKVTVFDTESRSAVWSSEVDGVPYGLAVADARLYVSTSRGKIYCFDSERSSLAKVLRAEGGASPYDDNAAYAKAADEIIEQTGVTAGYCLDLGCGSGRLAYELAERSNLWIYAIDPEPANVRLARAKLDAAGLYGTRVTVHCGDPAGTPYPNYFADLIVSARSVTQGADIVPAAEMSRVQRPYGGLACVGRPGAMKKTRRGPLKGAGVWTHQYCDAANTCCSTDTLVRGPLKMLWFTDNDLLMPSRHGRGPAPLFDAGRLIVEGRHAIRAVDAYNGRVLWQFPLENILVPYDQEHLMGTAGTNSNFCLANDTVYVRTDGRCLRLDVATGKKLAEFDAPPHPAGKTATWGYIACTGDTLFGSLANERHVVTWNFGAKSDMGKLLTESSLLFALDATTGKLKWTYTPAHSIRHNAIAIGNGRVYLIDRPLDDVDRLGHKPAQDKRRGRKPKPARTKRGTPELLALDAADGKPQWRTAEDIYGTTLLLSTRHDVLLMSCQLTRFALPSEQDTRMTAFRASDGTPLWEADVARPEGYSSASRPIINDRTIIMEPGALDLLTGKPRLVCDPQNNERKPWRFDRSYGCGIIAAAPNLMVFRSATLGYRDLLHDTCTSNYGGIRPGCWINAIPAGGLVLLPDATERCDCSYLIKASIALQPMN